jgi:hypothetical protein
MSDGVRIPLRRRDGSVRAYAIVDAADADWVNQWHWSFSDGYAVRNATSSPGEHHLLGMHRDLMGIGYGDVRDVDHKDRDRLNNRRSNLRVITKAGNRQNMPGVVTASSRYRGVSWHRHTAKWRAYVCSDGKYRHLGLFTDEVEAAEAARAARLRLLPYSIEQEIAS